MTHNEVFEVLEELSLPIAYDHFAEPMTILQKVSLRTRLFFVSSIRETCPRARTTRCTTSCMSWT